MDKNNTDMVKQVVRNEDFRNYFNYLTPKEFLGFFSFNGGVKK